MLPRVLEPEVMDAAAEAESYDAIDHSHVNSQFAIDLLHHYAPATAEVFQVLDLGTGTALIPIEICRRCPQASLLGIDLSAAMLHVAQCNVQRAGFAHRIQLQLHDAKTLAAISTQFDAVVSNSLLHHLPQPQTALAQAWRIVRPGGLLFMRDLFRPTTHQDIEALVARHAATATPPQAQLLRQSLAAALTADELRELAAWAGIEPAVVKVTTDRHVTLLAQKPIAEFDSSPTTRPTPPAS